MKIKDLIDLIEIKKDFDIQFIPKGPGRGVPNELTIFPTSRGIGYWEDADIWFLGIDESCKEQVYEIKTLLKQNINGLNENEDELDKFLAVSELLIAIDRFEGGLGKFDIEKAKEYVSKINRKIVESLDFEDILGMKDLKYSIENNKLYRQLCFNVCEVYCNKKDRYRGYGNKEKRYCFGNEKYHEELDVVDITIFTNYIELSHRKEGREHHRDLDIRNDNTTEQKILSALDCWKCAY